VCDRAKESCPVFQGAVNVRHWSFANPAVAPLEVRLDSFRQVCDEIADKLLQFLIEEAQILPAEKVQHMMRNKHWGLMSARHSRCWTAGREPLRRSD
jgi:hypothetical protein